MSTSVKIGDMYACQNCSCEIQVIENCECTTPCADFRCCGQPMKSVTESPVRKAGDQSINDGLEKRD